MIILAIIVLVVARNTIIGWMIDFSLKKKGGFSADIHSVALKLSQPNLLIQDLKILNPKGSYRESLAAKVDRLEVNYDPMAFYRGEPRLQKLVIDISEIMIVKNRAGEMNWLRFQNAFHSSQKAHFQIDELVLSIGSVSYLDENRSSEKPLVYKIQIKERRYKNIKTADDIKRIITQLITQVLPKNLLDSVRPMIDQEIQKRIDPLGQGAKRILDIFGNEPQKAK